MLIWKEIFSKRSNCITLLIKDTNLRYIERIRGLILENAIAKEILKSETSVYNLIAFIAYFTRNVKRDNGKEA